MADASRHKLFIVAEDVYGVTPTNPTFTALRHTGTTLGMAKGTQLSEELRADRHISDYRHGTRQIGGDISFELSYGGAFDLLLAAVLCGTWAPASIGGAIAASGILTLDTQPTAGDTMTIGSTVYTFRAAADFDTAGEIPIGASLAATQASVIAAIEGTDGINTAHTGVSVGLFDGDDELTITALTAGTAGNSIATTETFTAGTNLFGAATLTGGAAAGASVDVLVVGTTRRSFSILRVFEDMGPSAKKYHLFTGCEFNTFQLSVTPEGITSGSFSIIGRDAGLSDNAPAGSTFGTLSTSRVFNGFGGSVSEDGSPIAVATEITATLENGIEPRFVIGDDKTIRPSIGRSNLSGTLGAWFEDAELIGKFYDEENSSLDFTLTDPDGNSLRFTIPNISFTGGQPDVSGQAAIPLSIPFQALLDPSLNTSFRIAKIPA